MIYLQLKEECIVIVNYDNEIIIDVYWVLNRSNLETQIAILHTIKTTVDRSLFFYLFHLVIMWKSHLFFQKRLAFTTTQHNISDKDTHYGICHNTLQQVEA